MARCLCCPMRHCTAKRWAQDGERNLFAGSWHGLGRIAPLSDGRRFPRRLRSSPAAVSLTAALLFLPLHSLLTARHVARCRCDQVHATAPLTVASTTHRQVLLVNSNSVLCCLTGAGAACGCLPRLPPRRRRAGAVSARRSPADFALAGDAAAALSVRNRSRWTFPSTAERDRSPMRTAIAAAVRPSLHSLFKRSICSLVHDSVGTTSAPRSPPAACERRPSGKTLDVASPANQAAILRHRL